MKSYEPRANSGVERALIEFEMLVDVDFGVIKTISKYYHTDYFSIKLLDVEDENIWLGLIHDNDTLNPVKCVMNPEIDDADDFYNCLMQEEEMIVYSQSCLTGLYDFIISAIGTNGLVEITILCKNEAQKQVIESLFPWINNNQYLNIDIYDPKTAMEPYDVSQYSSLFARYIQSLIDHYIGLDGKSVFLYECLTNLDIQLYKKGTGLYPHPLYASIYTDISYIRIISLYQYDNTYFPNNDYPFSDSDVLFNDNVLDEFMDPGEGIIVSDDEVEEYHEYLAENGIKIDAQESEDTSLDLLEDSEIINDISIDSIPKIDQLIKNSLPVMEAHPDLSYLETELKKDEEEEFDNE